MRSSDTPLPPSSPERHCAKAGRPRAANNAASTSREEKSRTRGVHGPLVVALTPCSLARPLNRRLPPTVRTSLGASSEARSMGRDNPGLGPVRHCPIVIKQAGKKSGNVSFQRLEAKALPADTSFPSQVRWRTASSFLCRPVLLAPTLCCAVPCRVDARLRALRARRRVAARGLCARRCWTKKVAAASCSTVTFRRHSSCCYGRTARFASCASRPRTPTSYSIPLRGLLPQRRQVSE
jgi:hypothetical protein